MNLNRVAIVGEVQSLTGRDLDGTPAVAGYLAEGKNVHPIHAIGAPAKLLLAANNGARVVVEGKLASSTWTDADDKRHSRSVIEVAAVFRLVPE